MKTKLSFVISTLALIIICTSCANNETANKSAEVTEGNAIVNNTLAHENLKGKVKTVTHIYETGMEEDGKIIPKEPQPTLITTCFYNEEGFLNKQEAYTMENGEKKLASVTEYSYKDDKLDKAVSKNTDGNIFSTTTTAYADNKLIETQIDGKGTLSSKNITTFSSTFKKDTLENVFFKRNMEPDYSIVRVFTYGNDGLPEKETMIPKKDGQYMGVEYYSFVTYNVISKDHQGNPTKYTISINMADGTSYSTINTRTYEYYK